MILVFVIASVLFDGLNGQTPIGTSSSSTVHTSPTGDQYHTRRTDTFTPLHGPGLGVGPVIGPANVRHVSSHVDYPGSPHNPTGLTAVQHTTATNTHVQPGLGHLGQVATGPIPLLGSIGATGIVGGLHRQPAIGGFSSTVSGIHGPVISPFQGLQTQHIGGPGYPFQGVRTQPIGALGPQFHGLHTSPIGGLRVPPPGVLTPGIRTIGLAARPQTVIGPVGIGPTLGVGGVVGSHVLGLGRPASERHSTSVDTHVDVNNHHNPSNIPVLHTSHTKTSERRPGISPVPIGAIRPTVVHPGIGLAGAGPLHGGIHASGRSKTTVERHIDQFNPHNPTGIPVEHVVRTDTHERPAIPGIGHALGPFDAGLLIGDVGYDQRRGMSRWEARRMGDRWALGDRDGDRRRRRRLRRRRFD